MARHTKSNCRLCRRENLKLFLKGERCYTEKCAYDRRNYPPGQHGQARKKFSEYGTQLREKQKVKRMYGILENQFRNIFKEADRQKGITGETLLSLLERRLDNIVYRLGFANSRNEARQLVRHNHFLVNQFKVNIPSYLVKPGDVIELREKSRKVVRILEALEGVARRGVPQWLELDKDQMKGGVKGLPTREDITIPIQEKLIVELFSK
ncbi:MAG: 30S ribosomal protein S4 [Deltaproteobacteria bacterium CG_4_8_14_3_um_filter_45_9]|nr:MAG: 30S ribosomal protein S4 [Deltaproteobacteria bacterium CG03_land_8_20_14_0_80_45_14]PIX22340.1 MAG: 30S ribosomal protein S4 [Deltaproteobacteria bacterium CG_4_8_14_3_um_filter_45_9]